jgi:hypothetical protein
MSSTAARGLRTSASANGVLAFTGADNEQQAIDPSFVDQAQFITAAATLGWKVTPADNGEYDAVAPNGNTYHVAPSYQIQANLLGVVPGAANLGSGFRLGADGQLYFIFSTLTTPYIQAFTVK